MYIGIEKWHGCKNDFIVTWMIATDRDTVLETLKRLAPKICSRDGSGIGADGILVLEVQSRKDLYPQALHIVNSDGSMAANCGNGLRCAAMSVRRNAQKVSNAEIDGVSLAVNGVSIDCRFLGRPSRPIVAVTMPIPKLNKQNSWHEEILGVVKKISESSKKSFQNIATVEIGNPHVVIGLDEANVEVCKTFGEPLQKTRGGDGINSHVFHSQEIEDKDRSLAKSDLGEPIGELFKVWPWERGVGLTQACGTGACAVAVAAYEEGSLERSKWVACDMPGGRLYVKQSEEEDAVILAGPAEFVFAGELEI